MLSSFRNSRHGPRSNWVTSMSGVSLMRSRTEVMKLSCQVRSNERPIYPNNNIAKGYVSRRFWIAHKDQRSAVYRISRIQSGVRSWAGCHEIVAPSPLAIHPYCASR